MVQTHDDHLRGVQKRFESNGNTSLPPPPLLPMLLQTPVKSFSMPPLKLQSHTTTITTTTTTCTTCEKHRVCVPSAVLLLREWLLALLANAVQLVTCTRTGSAATTDQSQDHETTLMYQCYQYCDSGIRQAFTRNTEDILETCIFTPQGRLSIPSSC